MAKSVSYKKNILVTSVTDAPLLNQQLKFERSTFSHNSHFTKGGRRKAQSLKYSLPQRDKVFCFDTFVFAEKKVQQGIN